MQHLHTIDFFITVEKTLKAIDKDQLETLVERIALIREGNGRIFFLGIGGSAANASHAVNDFRKLCCIEAYCATDNVAELTARINDEGWDSSLSGWLGGSQLSSKDAVFVFSVGGGNLEQKVSVNLIRAVEFAKTVGCSVLGVVGRDGGYTKSVGDCVIVIPTVNNSLVTPVAEAFQGVVWHYLVSHPKLQRQSTKW